MPETVKSETVDSSALARVKYVLSDVEPARLQTPAVIEQIEGPGRRCRYVTTIELLLLSWVYVELTDRIWFYLCDQQYSLPSYEVELWDALAIAKRTIELADQGCPQPFEVAFSEYFGRHPSKLIPVFEEMRRAHRAARLAKVIEFPAAHGAEGEPRTAASPMKHAAGTSSPAKKAA